MRKHFVCALLAASLGRFAAGQPRPATEDQAPRVLANGPAGWLGRFTGFYIPKPVSDIDIRNSPRIYDLIRAGNIYLSLNDAIALALENNLDLEVSRFQIPFAATDLQRAKGGGTLRGVSLNVTNPPLGVGGPQSPLLNVAAASATPSTSVPSDVFNPGAITATESSLAVVPGLGGAPGDMAAGPPIPQYDPAILGNLQWQHQTTPEASTLTSGTNTLVTKSFAGSANLTQGFGTGTQYALGYNTLTQNVNSVRNVVNPYSSASLGLTVTQPLLRGFGISVNRRYINMAKNDQQISNLVFRQQVINTVFGVMRLYFDLAALAEDLRVKQETLAAARTLYDNTKAGVEEGTLAPLELTRAEAQVAAAEQDLINSQGLFDQQEAILKNLLTRRGTAEPVVRDAHIVATEALTVPAEEPVQPLEALLRVATDNRPDLAQAGFQIANSELALKGTRNELLPQLDLVGTAQNSGLAGQQNPNYQGLGTLGGTAVDPALVGGYGSVLDQVFSRKYPTYSIGVQLNLPLRNRVAQADMVRDELNLREAQTRRQALENQARLEVEDAMISLRRARAAYEAAVRTRRLQEQSLDVEKARFEAGVDTLFFVLQYQSYLAQARSTEVAAKGNYFKAKAALDRALGTTLETNGVSFEEAYRGRR